MDKFCKICMNHKKGRSLVKLKRVVSDLAAIELH